MARQRSSSKFTVVGGGISGLYTAWRLSKTHSDIILFEAQERLGGRIFSKQIPGTNIIAELGAMRFARRHELLCSLIDQLSVETKKFDFPKTWFYYLRGRRLLDVEMEMGYCRHCNAPSPYRTGGREGLRLWQKTPGQLINYAFIQCLMGLAVSEELPAAEREKIQGLIEFASGLMEKAYFTPEGVRSINPDWGSVTKEQWKTVKKYGEISLEIGGSQESVPLRDTGFWNLLEHYLGNEGFQLVHDALGYESIVGNWNSAEAMPWFVSDFAEQEENYRTVCGGMSRIVDKLAEQLGDAGVELKLLRTAIEVKRLAGGDSSWQITLRDERTGEEFQHFTENVVLALPRRPLEALDIKKGEAKFAGWSDVRKKCLPAVAPHRLFKVLLVFPEAWWENKKIDPSCDGEVASNGRRAITDLPIRQVYYYGPEWIREHCPKIDGESIGPNWAMVMASYSDSHYVSYWKPFTPSNGEHIGTFDLSTANLPPGDPIRSEMKELARELGVPARMIEKLRHQLADLHGIDVSEVGRPVIGIFADWGGDPHERGGWHSWEVGEDGEAISKRLEQPLAGERLFTCGEAYSSEQGWIEGALQSAERTLRKISQLDPPMKFSAAELEAYIEF